MQELIERMERDSAKRKRAWKIVSLVVGLFMLVYGLPRIFIAVGDSARDELDLSAYDMQFQVDLDGVELWYHLARYSPLTWGLANSRRAELRIDLGQEIYLDGTTHRSRRHFEAAWDYFEQAAEIQVTRGLVARFSNLARRTGRADRLISLAQRFPQYADALAFDLRPAYLLEGRFADAAPLLSAECQQGDWPYLCEQAVLTAAVAGDLEMAEVACRRLVQQRQERRVSPTAAPGTKEPGQPNPPGKPAASDSYRVTALLSARVLLARVLAKAGKHEAALAELEQILNAGQSRSWPLAVLAKAAVLRASQRGEEADRFLLDPGGEQAVRQQEKHLSGDGWDFLALRRAVTHRIAGRADQARAVLKAHFHTDAKPMKRWMGYPFSSSRQIIARSALLPQVPLAQALKELAADPDESVVQVRNWVGLVRCRGRLAAHDLDGLDACLAGMNPPLDAGVSFGLRYWAAIAGAQAEKAAELCVAEATSEKPDSDLEHKWMVAELRAGRYSQARALLDQRAGRRFDFGTLDPESIRTLLDGLVSLSAKEPLADTFHVPDPKQVHSSGRALPRLQLAMAALSDGDPAAAVWALGDRNLHYHIFMMNEWEPFARALFRLADPSGREQAQVLLVDAHSLVGSVSVNQPMLIWFLADIASLQAPADAERTRASVARHQASVPVITELRWGL